MIRVPVTPVAQQKKTTIFRILSALLALLALPVAPAQAQGWPASIQAEYDVTYNGFSVGGFAFKAQAERESYTLSGNASLSMLLGIINWTGDIRTFGSIVNQAPKPALFSFDARAGNRAALTRVGFEGGVVNSVARIPEMPARPGTVPVREQHLRGVVDPLSAMMMVTQGAAPCERRLPIYDGHERFDLVLTRKGEMRIGEAGGQPGIAHVCKVRYVPIAGHTSEGDSKFMAANDGIEVVLRPVPGAKLFVPYQITIPMPLGSATLTSKRVEITQAGKRIALLH